MRGYWGDVVASPYWATGTCVEVPPEADVGPAAHRAASSMFAVNNRHAGAEQFRHNAAEVAVLGILSLLTEIETAARYTMAKAHDIYSGLGGSRAAGSGAGPGGDDAGSPDEEAGPRTMDGAEVAPIGKKSASETAAEAAEGMTPREAAAAAVAALPMAPERSAERRRNALVARSVRRARAAASAIRSVRLVPLLGDIDRLLSHSRNRHRFSGAVIGCRSAQLLERPALAACLRPRAFVVQEAARNIVVFKQHQKDEFERRAVLMAGSLGLVFAGSDRTVAGTDKFAAGSVIDARPRAAKEADQRKREAALEEDKAAAAGAGDHAAGILYLRCLAHWDERRGDNPRPEALVFKWDEAAAPARAEAIGKGPAGRAIREVMLQTQAELQAKEDAARRAAKAAAAGESGEAEPAAAGPAAAASQRPVRAGAGAAWARGGAGSKVRRLKTEGGEAAASSQGAASGDEQGAAGGAAEPVAEAAQATSLTLARPGCGCAVRVAGCAKSVGQGVAARVLLSGLQRASRAVSAPPSRAPAGGAGGHLRTRPTRTMTTRGSAELSEAESRPNRNRVHVWASALRRQHLAGIGIAPAAAAARAASGSLPGLWRDLAPGRQAPARSNRRSRNTATV